VFDVLVIGAVGLGVALATVLLESWLLYGDPLEIFRKGFPK
jgi:hypothetical protein